MFAYGLYNNHHSIQAVHFRIACFCAHVCFLFYPSISFCLCVRARTCVSDRLSAVASSTLSGVDRYRWISNLFSRPDSCESEKTVRAFLRLQCFPGNSAWCWNKAGICIPAGDKKHSYNYPKIMLTRIILTIIITAYNNNMAHEKVLYKIKSTERK